MMSEINQVYEELKRQLRASKVTYAELARRLSTSEASVKRWFSQRTLSLQRIEAICTEVDVSFSELVANAATRERPILELSEAHEEELIRSIPLLLAAICVTNRIPFEEMLSRYRFDELKLIRLLAQLDRMGIIELLPENRYRVRVSRDFRWRQGGPIHRYFFDHVANEFLWDEKGDDSYFRFVWGSLSRSQMDEVKQRVDRLASEFVEISERTSGNDPKKGSTMLIGFRGDWEPSSFEAARR
ncbi:MAG: helix-turn-helix transcriptional regulator [Pseudomonadota bacterium]